VWLLSRYLSIEVNHVRKAWDACQACESRTGVSPQSNEQLKHARRIAMVHVPQKWPHGVVCRNDHSLYPCAPALWAYEVLKTMRWDISDLMDLLEVAEVG